MNPTTPLRTLGRSPLADALTQTSAAFAARQAPERPATSAAAVRAERDADAERSRIEASLDAYGDADPGDDGDILTFARMVPSKADPEEPTTLHYAFIRSGGRYFGTGGSTPNGVTYAALVDWLIDLGIEIGDVGALDASENFDATLDAWA